MLVQKLDQATGSLQGMIEGAIQNFLGFATSSTSKQQFISLEDNEEYLSMDNEEEEADVEKKIVDVMEYMTTNNIDILGLAETNVNKNTLKTLEHTVQDKFKLYFTTEEKKGTGIRFLVKKEFIVYVQQFQYFKGRIGFIDFYTKKKKICIVQAYINVQDKEKPQVKRLYKQIEHWTNQCLDSFVKNIIIMGDFNTKWNEYEFLMHHIGGMTYSIISKNTSSKNQPRFSAMTSQIFYKNDNNEDILYTEENKVKEQTNLHFQAITGAINCEKDLSQYPEWQEQYQPKRDVQYTIYSDLIKYLTLDEWIDNVKSLPNNKASGPSGISYKILKNLNEDNQSLLHAFICVCMNLNDIPAEWKKATIYPIPKPKPFFANLTNTRPITLLETPQKAFISLLNRRLSRILKNNNVLKRNQFAALPGNSTFEPIRMINEIIQDAKENNKELWLLSQDLGKAYDCVNIFILEKAMERIKIPSNFIKIISSLFNNRQNQVITAYGLTDPYDVLIGIDQEEVISPLLWCIYYDPLLCEIEQRKLGYTLEAPKIALNKFYGEDTSDDTEKLTISSNAYMDDTQWLAPSQNNLEKILEIADSFYKLNDIQVNKEKSELLVRYKQGRYRPKLKPHEPVTLRFGSDSIFIIPVSP
ncbi:hypothetical protein RclHR1_13270007 [Rhizophagus clarus]|uniref:Reverse transcriptase domain-containing protein n=1 Tax=Rhizophagus clarus TaxID=94130 RepID=A0A2Z6QBD5_9GLOM|nr:hypothetical protein RclHR1_13270007 [Rhizophagus clarus]